MIDLPMQLIMQQAGAPLEVVQIAPQVGSMPASRQVKIQMLYAPVNPADLNFIEGTYGKAPQLPSALGIEGCGRVLEVGDAVKELAVGDLVMILDGLGTWANEMICDADQLLKLPEDFDLQQAAMLKVNPPTALLMLRYANVLKPGGWIAQNAANSAAGRCVIQIAKQLGFKTLNFVRRPELIPELLELGADAVFIDDRSGANLAKEHLQGETLALALNAVGGDSALRLMDLLSVDGHLVTYGAMSRRGLKVPNRFLIFKTIHLHGFWLTQWLSQSSKTEVKALFAELIEWIQQGKLKNEVAEIFELRDYDAALQKVLAGQIRGKVLFRINA